MLAPTRHIAAALAIPAGTIRYWHSLGWITQHGTAGRAALYDTDEIIDVKLRLDRERDTPSATLHSA